MSFYSPSCCTNNTPPSSLTIHPITILPSHQVTTRKDVDRRVPADQALMENIAKYSVYMIAIYTHLLAVYMQPCTGLCCLCCSRFKSQESGRASRNDDFFCGLCKNNKQLFKDAQQRVRSSSSGSCTASPSHLLHEKHSSPIATNVVIKGDNCCGANHAGLSHFTKDIDTEVCNLWYSYDTYGTSKQGVL